jgi:hypothetical protein
MADPKIDTARDKYTTLPGPLPNIKDSVLDAPSTTEKRNARLSLILMGKPDRIRI